ncbi:MAG TPA: hypothetical protein VIJ95_08145 [Hanamia sp.]
MKKYLTGIVAIMLGMLLAFGTSAFKGNKKHHNNIKADTEYYWYDVNSSGQIVAGSEAYDGNKEDMVYANDNLPCTPGTVADCVRGFNSQLTQFPTSSPGVVSIKRN